MKVARVYSAQVVGLSGAIISVETDVSSGVYSFTIVGLPDKSVDEAKERVHAALKNSDFDSPKSRNHKLTVSLAPADIRKEGPVFDLAIAISYLVSVGDIKYDKINECIFVGELSLMGEMQKINGALAIARAAHSAGYKKLFLPKINAHEAALIRDVEVYGVNNIKEVVEFLQGKVELDREPHKVPTANKNFYPDISEIRGQFSAKRALEIAAAGGHNICLYGPPGTGKTMLAKAFTGILPPLSFEESLEVTGIHSIAGATTDIVSYPPMRAPHHTSSYVSIIGGGSVPKPGEITLAHRGVLFLDEFPEFEKKCLESLREPLEEAHVRISRARGSEVFPARFILVAAMNPCPCGYAGSRIKQCTCKPGDIERYQRKISGPIMDRIDLWTFVQHLPYEELSKEVESKNESDALQEKIKSARSFAKTRNEKLNIKDKLNRELSPKEISIVANLSGEEKTILNNLATQFMISPRAYHRVLRVARTIADLEGSEKLNQNHIIEAFQYRPKLNA